MIIGRRTFVGFGLAGVIAAMGSISARAQDRRREPVWESQASGRPAEGDAPMSLTQSEDSAQESSTSTMGSKTTPGSLEMYGYREVSDFFNIREANPQVDQCEWEFESVAEWFTHSGEHDEVGLEQSLKYGITDDLFVELEVTESKLGEGANQGNGDIVLLLFNRFVRETECLPALAALLEVRLPTGDGSSGVDGRLNGLVTKSLTERFRAHFEGFVETANGDPNAETGDRRHFQWGMGPGFDYAFDESTLALINYLNRSSEENGQHNNNLLELGVVREIYHVGDIHQHVKFALDIGLDGQEDTPNLGAKILYSIDFK